MARPGKKHDSRQRFRAGRRGQDYLSPVMPESKGYKPFGTSATHIALFEPLTEYSQRYDTWEEAELAVTRMFWRASAATWPKPKPKWKSHKVLRAWPPRCGKCSPSRCPTCSRSPVTMELPGYVLRYGELTAPLIEIDVNKGRERVPAVRGQRRDRRTALPTSTRYWTIWTSVPVDGILTTTADNARQLGMASLRLGQAVAFCSLHSPT